MKYKSCNLLMGGIQFGYDGISLCQRVDHIGGGDIVIQPYNDKEYKNFKFDLNKYIEKRNEIINYNKTGKVYPKCENCVELQEKDWDDEDNKKIFQIILHHWSKCNSHCIYCYTNTDKDYFNSRKNYQVLPILKQFAKNNIIEYGGMCCFAGGEVSCLPEFESIIRLLNKYDMFYIFNSSCVEYEKSIEKYLKYGSAMLIVSVDSGTRELHNKIKQVDTYDCVWKNIAKYSHYAKRKELIYTKYIVLKDINDNETAIEAFLTKSKEAGIKYVLMEIDHYYFLENRDNIPKYIIDLFYYAFNKAKEMDLICEIYSNSSVLLLQGKWADEFWHPHVFDTSKKIEALTKIYKITKELYYTKYDNIISAASQNHLSYKDVLKSCKKNSCGKKCKINNDYYFYAKDIEINSSVNNDNVKLDWVKINSIIGFLKYKKLK